MCVDALHRAESCGGHFRVDKHSLRQLNRHARVHERAAFPFAEDAVDFGEVCARIATQNFASVGGHFCQHGLALAAYHCDSIGQIDFVVFVVGFYLREGRPKIFQREAVNRGIDFVDFALLVGQLRFLDNRGNSRLGFADTPSCIFLIFPICLKVFRKPPDVST